MKKCYLLFFSVLVGIALCGIPPVYAQGDDSDEFELEEITVTAQKRAESQQKVPIAMEVISGADITELGMNDIDEILSGVANTIIEKTQDGYRVNIRGITDNSMPWKGQSMAPPTVAINMDGVFSNKKDTGTGLFDVERVEVLYGPQSTMYSSNSPGGIVNVVTANPKLDQYEGSGSVEYGNYNLVHTEGVMNAPLFDTVALRASFSTSKRDPFVSGTNNDDEDIKSIRLRALIQPSDTLSFVLTGENVRNKSAGFGGGVQVFDTQDGQWMEEVAKVERQNIWVPAGKVTDPWIGATTDRIFNSDQISDKIYGQFDIATPAGDISLTPSYSRRNGTNHMEFSFPGEEPEEHLMTQFVEEKSIEFRMSSPEDFPFKWIIGGNYYSSWDENFDTSDTYLESGSAYVNVVTGADPTRPNNQTGSLSTDGTGTYFPHWGKMSDRIMDEESKAFFANVTYPITDAFRATLGYRQSWDTWETHNYEIKGQFGTDELEYAYEYVLSENDGEPDYKVGVEYDLAENSMLYADYATSYRIQGMGGSGQEQDPETLKAYTVGAKNRFLDNRLQANVAAYYYDYQNYQASGNDTETWIYDSNHNGLQDQGESERDGGANGTGDGRVIGVDLSASWIITPKDRLNMTASWIDSEWTDLYIDYEYNQQFVAWDDNGTPGDTTDDIAIYEEVPDDDFSGKPMMSSPPLNVNLTYDHSFSLPNGGSLKAALSVKYKTSYRLSWRLSDYPVNKQEAFHTEDVNLVYNDPEGKMSFSVYCKNIENYAEKRSLINASGTKLLSIGNPRTYGAVLSVKF